MKSLTNVIIFIALVYIALTQVFPRVFALFYEARNATVVLDGCDSDSCHLKGTLTTDPVTLESIITDDDGMRHYATQDQIALIIIPQEQRKKD